MTYTIASRAIIRQYIYKKSSSQTILDLQQIQTNHLSIHCQVIDSLAFFFFFLLFLLFIIFYFLSPLLMLYQSQSSSLPLL